MPKKLQQQIKCFGFIEIQGNISVLDNIAVLDRNAIFLSKIFTKIAENLLTAENLLYNFLNKLEVFPCR